MIKSAASAASPKTKIWESRGAYYSSRPRRLHAEPSSAGSPGCLDSGLQGGCASNRLDHGLEKLPRIEAEQAADLITAAPNLAKIKQQNIEKSAKIAFHIGLRSEIGESRSEKELFTLLKSKLQNDPNNSLHAPKQPETAYLLRT